MDLIDGDVKENSIGWTKQKNKCMKKMINKLNKTNRAQKKIRFIEMDERKETIDNRNDINKVEMIEREDITDNKGVIEKRDIIDNQEMIGIIDNLETAKKFSKTMMKIVMKKNVF